MKGLFRKFRMDCEREWQKNCANHPPDLLRG